MTKAGNNIRLNLKFLIVFLIWLLFIGTAIAKDYDGIWFLGFNLRYKLFQKLKVRQAVAHCLDKDFIATEIMSEEALPASIIPPGMLGHDPELKPYKCNPEFAKLLMKRAGYSMDDARLKRVTLLHTDGVKTIAIAEKIRSDLKQIGMNINLVQVSYQDQEKWAKELASKEYDLFLLGYKAGIENLFTSEASPAQYDSYSLVEPLFAAEGEANFSSYHNSKVDALLEQLEGINLALREERNKKLKEINKLLYKDLPAVVLFYIEKL